MIIPVEFDGSERERGYKGCEEDCHALLSKILPKEYVAVFHKQTQSSYQSDILLLVPEKGVLVIEMKAWEPQNIKKVDIAGKPVLVHSNQSDTANYNPLNQAKNYCDIYREELKSDAVFGFAVWLSNMTQTDMKQKGFDVNCGNGALFMTEEDFSSEESFCKKVDQIFQIFEAKCFMPSSFYKDEMISLGNKLMVGFDQEYKAFISSDSLTYSTSTDYSILYSVANSSENTISDAFEKWKGGTKVYFFSSESKDVSALKSRMISYLTDAKAMNLYDKNKDTVFNCVLGTTQSIHKDFVVTNGEKYELYEDELKAINEDISVPFNFEQYKVEYSNAENIIVNAGAGSGKTFLLVSRIDYLCWKNDYSAEDLQEKIVLITFTNDATDEMKERLEKHFVKKYLLTRNERYFRYINIIENMRISTIDSISLKLIKKYAFYLGLGKDVSITTASIYRDEEIRSAINRVLKANHVNENQIPSYVLNKALEKALDKYSNRNIDLAAKQDIIGAPPESFLDYLFNELPVIERNIEARCEENNKIPQGLILVYLRRILKLIDSGVAPEIQDMNVEYLFIDEFQDTDDVQIEIASHLKKKLGFKLCVVGDVKQSIYRFRGANDDKAFSLLNDLLGEGQCIEYPLIKNYRTNAQMLAALNASFNKMTQAHFFRNQPLRGVMNPNVEPRIDERPVTSDDERKAEIISVINEFSNQSKPGENMCILVRSNRDVLAIRDICIENQLYQVNTEVGGKLYNQDSTLDLYKLSYALMNPQSAEALFNLYSTAYVDSELDKSSLIGDASHEFFEANLPKSLENWKEYVSGIRTEPVLKVLMNIIYDVKPWSIYATKHSADEQRFEEVADEYRHNLEKLLEKISTDKNGAYLSITSLVKWLSIMITTSQEEEERKAGVQHQIDCLTVHKAKGKEYNVVFLPFTDAKVRVEHFGGTVSSNNFGYKYDFIVSENGFGYSITTSEGRIIRNNYYSSHLAQDDDAQSHEEARILYVALTRLKERLVYINDATKPYNRSRLSSWRDMIFD